VEESPDNGEEAEEKKGSTAKRGLPDGVHHPRFVSVLRRMIHQAMRDSGRERVRVPMDLLACLLLLMDTLFDRILQGAYQLFHLGKKRTVFRSDIEGVIGILLFGIAWKPAEEERPTLPPIDETLLETVQKVPLDARQRIHDRFVGIEKFTRDAMVSFLNEALTDLGVTQPVAGFPFQGVALEQIAYRHLRMVASAIDVATGLRPSKPNETSV
jgi:histone H3/H4